MLHYNSAKFLCALDPVQSQFISLLKQPLDLLNLIIKASDSLRWIKFEGINIIVQFIGEHLTAESLMLFLECPKIIFCICQWLYRHKNFGFDLNLKFLKFFYEYFLLLKLVFKQCINFFDDSRIELIRYLNFCFNHFWNGYLI